METFLANTEPMAPNPDAIELPPANQFVTFSAGDKAYGVDVMTVREIRSWSPTTELPMAPSVRAAYWIPLTQPPS